MDLTKKKKFICEECNKSFTQKVSLQHHKQFSKSCPGYNEENKEKITCDVCKKELSSLKNLQRHKQTCICVLNNHVTMEEVGKIRLELKTKYTKKIEAEKKKCQLCIEKNNIKHKKHTDKINKKIENEREGYKKEIEELNKKIERMNKEKIEKYEETIANLTKTISDIAAQPSNVVTAKNVTVTNKKLRNVKCTKIKPLTEETVMIHAQKYDYVTFKKGLIGLVGYIRDMIEMKDEDGDIQRNYVCTDSSRDVFYRLIRSQEWKKDDGAYFLNTIFDNLSKQARRYNIMYLNDMMVFLHSDQTIEEKKEHDRLDEQKKKILEPMCSGLCGSIDSQERKNLLNDVRKAIKNIAQI